MNGLPGLQVDFVRTNSLFYSDDMSVFLQSFGWKSQAGHAAGCVVLQQVAWWA
jgi:hypothetical protein